MYGNNFCTFFKHPDSAAGSNGRSGTSTESPFEGSEAAITRLGKAQAFIALENFQAYEACFPRHPFSPTAIFSHLRKSKQIAQSVDKKRCRC